MCRQWRNFSKSLLNNDGTFRQSSHAKHCRRSPELSLLSLQQSHRRCSWLLRGAPLSTPSSSKKAHGRWGACSCCRATTLLSLRSDHPPPVESRKHSLLQLLGALLLFACPAAPRHHHTAHDCCCPKNASSLSSHCGGELRGV